jgi:alpha-beta hydrolase superfamily lysophospholipase
VAPRRRRCLGGVASGTDDPVGENGKGVQRLIDLYRKKGLRISSRLYAGARHELVNETNKDEVTTDLRGWLLQFA